MAGGGLSMGDNYVGLVILSQCGIGDFVTENGAENV